MAGRPSSEPQTSGGTPQSRFVGEAARLPSQAAPSGHASILDRTIEQHVLPQLLRMHPPERLPDITLEASDVALMAAQAAARDPGPMFLTLEQMIAAGLPAETICLDVLAPAARHLGELWNEDEYDFSEVTIGVARLQQALRHLAPAARSALRAAGRVPRILLVPVPGEQHQFGLAMAADFFRRAGWAVTSGGSPLLEPLLAIVRRGHFDVVGFSASCDRHAPMLARALRAVRQSSRNERVVTMVGGPLFASRPELAIQLGADATATDGAQAPITASLLVRSRLTADQTSKTHTGQVVRMMPSRGRHHSEGRDDIDAAGGGLPQSRTSHYPEDRACCG